jgi:carbamoyltransferase
MKATYVVGINAAYHESSAAILKDGRLLAFAEEERFNRIKHGKPAIVRYAHVLPWKSINYCLRTAGIHISNVNYFGYSFYPDELLNETSGLKKKVRLRSDRKKDLLYRKIMSAKSVLLVNTRGNVGETFFFIPHHLCHAAGSYYSSGFKNSAVLVVDGIAEYASLWSGCAKKGRLLPIPIDEVFFPNSLGLLWEKFSLYLGFSIYDAAKVMGLSSHGAPKRFRGQFEQLLRGHGDGSFEVDRRFIYPGLAPFERLFRVKRRQPQKSISRNHMDLAASLQEATERVLVRAARRLRQQTQQANLCISGGVALNCVANTKIIRKSGFKNVYIQPAANDAGTALGAAYYVWNNVLLRNSHHRLRHTYWGPEYSDRVIRRALGRSGLSFEKVLDIAGAAAELLSEGKIVAWFQGRMEAGPRALGNRSILGDPRNPTTKDELNRKVKMREPFRPFCPSVLVENAKAWFELEDDMPSPAEYMLMAVRVRRAKERLVPAVVHIDKTCRVQIVKRRINPRFHRLLRAFKQRTGVPLVLNTSFNIQEPIVCSPEQALATFKRSTIEYLAIGDYLARNGKKPGERKSPPERKSDETGR